MLFNRDISVRIATIVKREVDEITKLGLRSGSLVDFKIIKLKKELSDLKKLQKPYAKAVKALRAEYQYAPYNHPNELPDIISSAIYRHKAGNCMENAALLKIRLEKKNIPSKMLGLAIVDDKNIFSPIIYHAFVGIGLTKSAIIKDPKTWGKNAIIGDSWLGVSGRADEVIKYYKSALDVKSGQKMFFGVNETLEDLMLSKRSSKFSKFLSKVAKFFTRIK